MKLLSDSDRRYLKELTQAVAAESVVKPGQECDGFVSVLPTPVVKPGGGKAYPSFWTRDFVMSAEAGIFDAQMLQDSFALLRKHQAQDDQPLPKTHSRIPKGAIPDHVNLEGHAIFYPGTYSPENQGLPFGYYPPYDDAFFFIRLAAMLPALDEKALPALRLAFDSVPAEPATGLVFNTEERWGISFGFMDTIPMTGKLLFASLLRALAARDLAKLLPAEATAYGQETQKICRHLHVFDHASGLLAASTGRNAFPDVWGTAFALANGLVDKTTAAALSGALVKFYRAGSIACEGGVRHVPFGLEASSKACWSDFCVSAYPLNTYQNGAYWHTPTGWLARALALTAPEDARQLVGEYLAHLRKNDYRHGGSAPWECFYPPTAYGQNPIYLTSVAAPLAVL